MPSAGTLAVKPNTQIKEAGIDAGEVEMLLFALERSRAQVAWKVGGFDEAGLRQPQPPSTMKIAGLGQASGAGLARLRPGPPGPISTPPP